MSRTDPSQRAQYDKALGYLLGDIAVGVAWIGLEAGLFAALRAREPLLASALADDRDLDPDAVAVWCRSAYAFEFVSYTHLTLPTRCHRCRSRWSPYH